MLAALLIYGFATGTFSSRRIQQACYDSAAFRFIAANTQPDHDTRCAFRRRFLPELGSLFVQVLGISGQMKLLKLGTIGLEGTTVHANASRHHARSYRRANAIQAPLKREVGELLARAERTHVTEAKQPVHEAKLAARQQKARDSGKRPGGKPPAPHSGGVRPTDPVNLTEPESRIMLRSGSVSPTGS